MRIIQHSKQLPLHLRLFVLLLLCYKNTSMHSPVQTFFVFFLYAPLGNDFFAVFQYTAYLCYCTSYLCGTELATHLGVFGWMLATCLRSHVWWVDDYVSHSCKNACIPKNAYLKSKNSTQCQRQYFSQQVLHGSSVKRHCLLDAVVGMFILKTLTIQMDKIGSVNCHELSHVGRKP